MPLNKQTLVKFKGYKNWRKGSGEQEAIKKTLGDLKPITDEMSEVLYYKYL